jgi:molybdopterin-synthase adenylyltransferase
LNWRYDEALSSCDLMNAEDKERYSRQILFAGIGAEGQESMFRASAVVVGCGAMGTAVANLLVRAGIGSLRLIDRDFVETSNLQRQALYEESDARENLPKAVAAERRLRAINSSARIEGIVADVTAKNARELLAGFPLVLDGTDNFETRLLINDTAIALSAPWIYAAAVASAGVTMTILPGETACLACLLESGESAAGAAEETCDTSGILNAAVNVIASIEAAEAMKILIGKRNELHGRLISFDVWKNSYRYIRVARNPDCRACVRREFRYLDGEVQPHVTMCGRDSVQIHERSRDLDLAHLSRRLAATASEIRGNNFLLRFRVNSYEITVFPDGRAIFKGTRDPAVARSLYARFIGA